MSNNARSLCYNHDRASTSTGFHFSPWKWWYKCKFHLYLLVLHIIWTDHGCWGVGEYRKYIMFMTMGQSCYHLSTSWLVPAWRHIVITEWSLLCIHCVFLSSLQGALVPKNTGCSKLDFTKFTQFWWTRFGWQSPFECTCRTTLVLCGHGYFQLNTLYIKANATKNLLRWTKDLASLWSVGLFLGRSCTAWAPEKSLNLKWQPLT